MVNGVPVGVGTHVGTYGVSPDGTITVDGVIQGGLLPSGDVAILVGTQDPPQPFDAVVLMVLVRVSTSASPQTMSGTYTLVGRRVDLPAGTQNALTGTASVTAQGTLAATWVENHEGTIGAPQTASLGFTIGLDGTLVVLGDDLYVGGVSPDGRVAVAVGGTEYGSDGGILVLSR